ncbi:MAG: SDR family oxidoreductase [Methyloversatilis discipulorum]|uniref:SDR family oxidoreductase n=1 Tax=Methyloversatilis discipulorum TaxID=1119528 RepID=UPI0026EE7C52|nr:SDR family oxidoreductase [Methyloversatilis discipulorum]MBV5287141.1 SDR family oxidoreductase [Methyloversatilis discipulorum]
MSRSILITGATGKIGRVLARHFLALGDTVIAAGRSVDALAELDIELSGNGGTLHTLCADLMAPNAAAAVVDGLRRIGCMPDGLINNARNVSFLRTGVDGRVARQDFLDEFALDVVTPYELVMALADAPDSRLRAVVNIGSQYGAVAPNLRLYADPVRQSPLQYGVAKAALAHLTKELAVRLADRGIRVNCVAFGGVEGRVDEAFKQRYAALCPIGRMLGEHELAGPVDLLLSDAASAVTGHVMMADGGWSVW